MREALAAATEFAVPAIDLLALVIVAIGTVQAFVGGFRVLFQRMDGHARRQVWIDYGRWLVAGLTFQLAADILETSIRTDWDSIGRLAAIAVVRTFLNHFLEKDIAEIRERQQGT